jgi:hypothetical protein
MPATIQIHEMTGSSAGVDKSAGTIRFKAADDTTVDTNDRLQIPPSGSVYSYTKQARFYFQSAPSVDIQNLRVYTDGTNSFGTGISVQYDLSGSFAANINTNISGTNIFTKISGTPIDLDAINTGPHTGTGYKGDFLRMQMTVSSAASSGTLASEGLVFAYDES